MNGKPRRNRAVAHRQVEGQTIVILPRRNEVMVLNTTGGVVWDLADGSHSLNDIAAELAARYDVSLQQARSDVDTLCRELIEAGVLELDG